MTSHKRETVQLAEQAADWVVRLDDEATDQCRAELVDWLRTSPKHLDEFLLAQASYRAFHELGPQHGFQLGDLGATDIATVVPLVVTNDGLQRSKSGSRSVATRWQGWAAAAVLAGLSVGLGLWVWNTQDPQDVFVTAVGEQRTVRLSDGSLLSLNTHSRAQVSFSKESRSINLLEGEVLFDVVPDPARPFRVMAGVTAIDVLGTQFNVRRWGEETRVSVVDGKVRVRAVPEESSASALEREEPPVLLAAGDEARVKQGESVQPLKADLEQTLAWRERRLVFRGTALAEVISEFNRYNRRQLRLEDERLAQRRISGVFHVDDPSTILKFLQKESALQIDENAAEIVIRGR